MAIKGSLREASLPDVLQLLALGRKTGCLSVTDRSEFGQIFFEQGNICYATIVNRRDRLGDLLVKNGLVAPEVLDEAVAAQSTRDGRRLGEILVQRGALTQEQLERYIRVQIEEAVYYLFTWTQGSFTFEVDQHPPDGAMLVSLNPESVLLEGARRVDEWSQIAKKIPSLEVVFGRDPGQPGLADADLTAEQRRVLPLLDGRRNVQEIIDESGMVEFAVGKALFGLIQAGFIHPVGRRATRSPDASSGREQEHFNLGVAFYRTGMLEEAVRELGRVLELSPDHLEARFFLGLVALRGGYDRSAVRHFRELAEAGGTWSAAFHNLALALERMGRLADALMCAEAALRHAPDHPRILLSHAILLCKSGRMEQATRQFHRCRQQWQGAGVAKGRLPSAYFAFAVLAEGACGNTDEALRLAEEGLDLHPDVAPLLLHAGAVRERREEFDEAESLYRRAAERDPALAAAQKALGDTRYRRGDLAAAAEAYERALDLAPGRGEDACFKLGNIRFKQGAREEAVRLWREALQVNPEHQAARANLRIAERSLQGAGA